MPGVLTRLCSAARHRSAPGVTASTVPGGIPELTRECVAQAHPATTEM
ncbi:MAG TPA: hypothetical protein VHV82_13320 [Sporichthyaceae bacterium]|nr:hypothetical protein [Sporichthyaceae bacterium]